MEQTSAFLASFATHKNDIAAGIESKSDWKALLLKLTNLRKEFVDANAYLPAYELRQCETQLKVLESGIENLRSNTTTKTRFNFKRNPKPASAPSPDTPVSATPEPSPSVPPSSTVPPSDQLSISNRSNSWITLESLDNVPSVIPPQSSLAISNISSSVLNLTPHTTSPPTIKINALHIRNMRRVILLAGYIDGSLLIHDCEDCLIILGCRQFRMHTSKNITIRLHVTSKPVIEDCTGIRVGSFPSELAQDNSFPGESQHLSMQDFNWIQPSPSPNWAAADGLSQEELEALRGCIDGPAAGPSVPDHSLFSSLLRPSI
ncbi:hypothetical protein DL93DRAFT_31831 [Clavulina sp. PMI_390]|nr:hypothetical protein DL93DRAFT_31831 [Clavulina sp. PMI_390]